MSNDRFKGLTRGNDRALDALKIERLADDEETVVYRVTAPTWVHDILRSQTGRPMSRALGALLAEKLGN